MIPFAGSFDGGHCLGSAAFVECIVSYHVVRALILFYVILVQLTAANLVAVFKVSHSRFLNRSVAVNICLYFFFSFNTRVHRKGKWCLSVEV